MSAPSEILAEIQPDAARNGILRRLDPHDLRLLLPRLERVALNVADLIHQAGRPIEHAYFIGSGIVSMIAVMADGSQAEVGLVGREGMVGLPLVLGERSADFDAMVQVPGFAWRLTAGALETALTAAPALGATILRYLSLFHAQVSQTAACNARHPARERLARWILMTADRVEDDRFSMTQEFMARMLGVLRPSVNIALRELRRSGAISHRHAELRVLRRSALRNASCECHQQDRDRLAAWLDDPPRP